MLRIRLILKDIVLKMGKANLYSMRELSKFIMKRYKIMTKCMKVAKFSRK